MWTQLQYIRIIFFSFDFLGHDRIDNIFLVPMHGGIWTLCIDLSEHEMRQLGPYGFPNAVKCISYLAENTDTSASDEYSQHGSYPTTRRQSMSKTPRYIRERPLVVSQLD